MVLVGSDKKRSGVYKITCNITGKYYIGSSKDIERRFEEHRSKSRGNSNKNLINSIKEYGIKNHNFEILEEMIDDQKILLERERYWQDFYNVLGPLGFNDSKASTGELKMIHSEETRSKMSKAHKGKILSSKTKEKMSLWQIGIKHSAERRRKNSEGQRGRKLSKEHLEKCGKHWVGKKHSEETKLKMSINNSKSKKVINTETGEIFNTIKAAANSKGIKASNLGEKLRGSIKNNTDFEYYKINN